MSKKLLGVLIGSALWTIADPGALLAQAPQQHSIPGPAAPAPTVNAHPDSDSWKAPFGGSFEATFTFTTDYSFRGISQTARQVAGQAGFGYESASIGRDVSISAYVGVWGSTFYSPNSTVEVDFLTGLRAYALDGKLTLDLGFLRYNYLGAASELFYDFNEFGLVVGYDFDVVQLKAAVYHSPNFYANSGVAWYKWAQVAVPLSFIRINENVELKLYGSIGNQYVERFQRYDISTASYWDWQIGLSARVYGFDMTVAYVDTNLNVANCGNTRNCEPRAVFTFSKSF